MDYISLNEYAKLNNKEISVVRKKCEKGHFITAKKIGRNWIIEKNEPYTDHRKKEL